MTKSLNVTQVKFSRYAVPWLRPLVSGQSLRRPGLYPRSVHVRFVVDEVALRQVFLRVLLFSPVSIIPLMPHNHLHLHVAVTRRTNGRSLGTFHKALLFLKSELVFRIACCL